MSGLNFLRGGRGVIRLMTSILLKSWFRPAEQWSSLSLSYLHIYIIEYVNIFSSNLQIKWVKKVLFHNVWVIHHPDCWNEMNSLRSTCIEFMFQVTLDFFASQVRHHQSTVCLIDCIRRLIGHSAGGWISTRAAFPPPLHHPTEFSRTTPLPCRGFHRAAPRPLFNTETSFTKDWWTKSMWENNCILPCDGFIPYLLDVYIYFL